jgi:hypothetical protein
VFTETWPEVPAGTLRALLDSINVNDRKSEALAMNLEVVKDYYGKVLCRSQARTSTRRSTS